jgi:steroid 5-alpha reductase family enzyme
MRLQMLAAIIASSYLTLGIFNHQQAKNLWAWYAATMFVLTIVNLWRERKDAKRTC